MIGSIRKRCQFLELERRLGCELGSRSGGEAGIEGIVLHGQSINIIWNFYELNIESCSLSEVE